MKRSRNEGRETVTAIAKYSELGLVNTKGMFMEAMKGRYAIPAYNFNNMEQLQAIIMGCSESRSPVIVTMFGQRHQVYEFNTAKADGERGGGDDGGSGWFGTGSPSPRPRRFL